MGGRRGGAAERKELTPELPPTEDGAARGGAADTLEKRGSA